MLFIRRRVWTSGFLRPQSLERGRERERNIISESMSVLVLYCIVFYSIVFQLVCVVYYFIYVRYVTTGNDNSVTLGYIITVSMMLFYMWKYDINIYSVYY